MATINFDNSPASIEAEFDTPDNIFNLLALVSNELTNNKINIAKRKELGLLLFSETENSLKINHIQTLILYIQISEFLRNPLIKTVNMLQFISYLHYFLLDIENTGITEKQKTDFKTTFMELIWRKIIQFDNEIKNMIISDQIKELWNTLKTKVIRVRNKKAIYDEISGFLLEIVDK
jgi:hypothetical protein